MGSTLKNGFPVTISALDEARAEAWVDANMSARGAAEIRRLSSLWHEAKEGKRIILVAYAGPVFAGHVTMRWQSEYEGFRRKNYPEIVDLWVSTEFRRVGIGRQLMDAITERAQHGRAAGLGLCVSVHENFEAARALYTKMGFRPDGSGLWRDGEKIDAEKQGIDIDEETVWMWVKPL
jgi:ribosomal protein S18 acetylase RimI-like enzyme